MQFVQISSVSRCTYVRTYVCTVCTYIHIRTYLLVFYGIEYILYNKYSNLACMNYVYIRVDDKKTSEPNELEVCLHVDTTHVSLYCWQLPVPSHCNRPSQ